MNPDRVKPPLGLRPRTCVDHDRAFEIHNAIGRHLVVNGLRALPVAWVEELQELITRYQFKP